MEDLKDKKNTEGVDVLENETNEDVEIIQTGLMSVYDGVMSEVKNCDAIFVSVNSNLVFLDGNCSVNPMDLVEYEELKERVDKNTLKLKCGESYVFTVRKGSELDERGILNVIAIITPEWQNGLNRREIVDQMDKGLSEAFMLSYYYDVDTIAISNIFPFMPTALVMDLVSHYMLAEYGNFKEICAIRGTDAEGVYRMNVLVRHLRNKYEGDLFVRVGGDIENDLLAKMVVG